MLINNKSLIKTINKLNLTDDEREKFNKISEDDNGNFLYNGKPVTGGATTEQVAQIQANTDNIEDIINNKLDGHTFKFLTQAEYDVLSDEEKNNPTIKYHITDAEETTGLTTEQEQQLQTAYEHSVSVHVNADDIPTNTSELFNDSNFINTSQLNNAINNAKLGTSEVIDSSVVQWKGKVATCLGDSITEGVRTTKAWHSYLQDIFGFSTVNNMGVNGSTIVSDGIASRYVNVPSDSDIIFVFGGTNDFFMNVQLGELYTVGTDTYKTRTLNTDISTFRGALSTICTGLKTNFPDKIIILMTPIHRYTTASQITDMQCNNIGLYIEDYVEVIKEVGKIFSIPVIDLYSKSGLLPMIESNANLYFNVADNDRLHPNAEGHKRIAYTIYNEISKLYPMNVDIKLPSGETPTKNLTSISAVFNQGSNIIYNTDNLNVLKQYLTVTATYDDNSTSTINSYTLNGTLSVGTSTITVTYSSKTTTFNVTVSEKPIETVTYTITNNLTNVTNNNSSISAESGTSYTATLTSNSGYTINSVTITMAGVNITNDCYSNGNINITNVSGDIVITASAITQQSSGKWEYITVDELTGIACTPRISEDNSVYLDNNTNQWVGACVYPLTNTSYKMTLKQVTLAQLIWYIFNKQDTFFDVLCIGGTLEHEKVYRMNINDGGVEQLENKTMPFSPEVNSVLRIEVNGTTQTLYANDVELITLTDCNTVGFANQSGNITDPVGFEFMKK